MLGSVSCILLMTMDVEHFSYICYFHISCTSLRSIISIHFYIYGRNYWCLRNFLNDARMVLKKSTLYFIHMNILLTWIYLYVMCMPGANEDQKEDGGFLELESQMVLRCHGYTENEILVLYKSSKSSWRLNDLSRPPIF